MNVKSSVGLAKLGVSFSVLVISIFVLSGLVGTALGDLITATHDSSAEIVPEWSPASTQIEHTITVTNIEGDPIYEVRIQIPVEYSNLVCGSPPAGWGGGLILEDGTYSCQYHATDPDYYIYPTQYLDFTLSAQTGLEGGEYTWWVRTRDIEDDTHHIWPTTRVDAINPEGSLSVVPSEWQNIDAELILNCDDGSGSGCDPNEDYLTVVPYDNECDPLLNPYIDSILVSEHSIACWLVTDNVDYTDEGSSEIKVDKENPIAGVSGAPDDWVNSDQTATVTCSDTGGSECNEGSYGYQLFDDSPGACPSDGYTNGNSVIISSHKWVCSYVEDNAGNSDVSDPVEFRVDIEEPNVALTPDPPETWTVYENGLGITLTCSDTGGSGCEEFGYQISEICSNDPDDYTKEASVTLTSPSYVCTYAKDVAGNQYFSTVPVYYKVSTTIQDAIDAASDGDTIIVTAGIYYENIIIDKSLTLSGDVGDTNIAGPGGDAPILDGENIAGDGIKILPGVSDITIEGFIIRNYARSGDGVGNAIQAWVNPPTTDATSNVIVRYNQMENLGWDAVLVGSEGQAIHTGWFLEYNLVIESAFYGLELTNAQDSLISNNDVITSGKAGILLQARNTISESGLITISGNEISDNGVSGGVSSIYLLGLASESVEPFDPITGAQAELTNTIVSGNTVTGEEETVRGIRVLGYQTGSIDAITVTGNTVTGANIGILVDGDVTGTAINNNIILGNDVGLDAINGIEPAIEEVNATYNYWGDATGPYHPTENLWGLGNEVTDNVDFYPWWIDEEGNVDSTPPIINSVVLDDYIVQGGTVIEVTADVSDENGVVAVTANGSPCTNTEDNIWECDITAESDEGVYTVTIWARDSAGNEAIDDIQSYEVDNTLPVINSVILDDYIVQGGTNIHITVEASDENGIVSVTAEGVSCMNNTDGDIWECDITAESSEEIYIVDVIAIDEAENEAVNSSQSYVVDNTLPTVSITEPVAEWYNDTVLVVHSESDDNLDYCEWRYNDGAWTPISCNIPFDFDTTNCPDGENTCMLEIKAIDFAENEGIDSVTFSVDNTPPTITYVNINDTVVQEGTTIYIDSDGADPQGVKSCWAYLQSEDGSITYASFNLGTDCDDAETLPTELDDGSYIINVRVRNNVYMEAWTNTTIIVDDTLPEILIINPEDGEYVSGIITIEATITEPNLESYYAIVDENYTVDDFQCENGYCTGTFDTTQLDDGGVVIEVSAVDQAGNQNSYLITVIIDNILPIITNLQPENGSVVYSNWVGISAEVCDEGSHPNPETRYITVDMILQESHGDLINESCISVYTEIELIEGEHTVTLGISDYAGHSNEVTWSFRIRTEYPIPLAMHWNLISLPLIPESSDIEMVLADILDKVESVWAYDTLNNEWYVYGPSGPSDLTEMRDGIGYWMDMIEPAVFTVYGVELRFPPNPLPEYPVYRGWNLIGFKSTEPMNASGYLHGVEWSGLISYNPGSGWQSCYYDQVCPMEPTYGYWLSVIVDGIIRP